MEKYLNRTDVLAGIFFFAVGLGFLYPSLTYGFGTGSQMGPGLFPALLSLAMMGLGAAIAINGVGQSSAVAERVGKIGARATVAIISSIALFALTLPRLGLVVSIMILVPVSCIITGRFLKWQTWLLAAALAVFSGLLFVGLLGLPIPLWIQL